MVRPSWACSPPPSWRRLAGPGSENFSLQISRKKLKPLREVWGCRRRVLKKLTPFVDKQGILRVGGRIKHALLVFDERHPVLLPTMSHFTKLIIDTYHRRILHGGTQLTLGTIRQHYWIPRGRALVKAALRRCIPCVRWRAAAPQQLMADLPRRRVIPARPFLHTGVDYAGPILLRSTRGRGHRAHKAFIVVFVCLSSKAVHLEVVSDYTVEAFLAALRRFTSCRGLCRSLLSDCGTNLLGRMHNFVLFLQPVARTSGASPSDSPAIRSNGGLILQQRLTSGDSGRSR